MTNIAAGDQLIGRLALLMGTWGLPRSAYRRWTLIVIGVVISALTLFSCVWLAHQDFHANAAMLDSSASERFSLSCLYLRCATTALPPFFPQSICSCIPMRPG